MRKMGTLLVVAAGLLIAADAKDDAVKKEKGKLKGTWEVVSVERGGKKLPLPPALKMTLTISDDKMTMDAGDNKGRESTYTIDPSKKPPTLDMTELDGPDKGKAVAMIYSVDTDELKLCGAEKPGDDRPTELVTKEGSKNVLMTLKRQKK